ncbi:unnamed protein product [Miscanthus lutarioriparius]|uniref:R13L1/DRL21-like LRR repeat region domain-containing protein n=1 Tax=Miscanthus lutarioriparius TaxID=422564 RepID=A0A811PI34_9POAL|nr:unnamed protein product [Miscanthus lutarioriparius]
MEAAAINAALPALVTLLHELRHLAYSADDVLDELDYFRIQDTLDGTYHAAADVHPRGCIHDLVRDACYTAKAVEVLDLQGWMGSFDLKGHISNLVKLRHFLVPIDELTSIFEVGKLEFLQELRKFNVRNEKGFELSQLGKLTELRGSLEISDLEKVQTKEEAVGAKLMHKSRLHELKLEWNTDDWRKKDLIHEQDVLESLRPHSNLRHLCIRGHGGISTSPSLDEKMNLAGNEQLQREVELQRSTTEEEGLVLLPPQLQELEIYQCQGLRLHPNTVEEAGGWLQGCLTKLSLSGTSIFFVGPDLEASWSHGQGLPPKLGDVETNDVGGILATPICSLLSSSLTKLVFSLDIEVKSFTEEQEKAIQLLTSLQHLGFQNCRDLQCLPAGQKAAQFKGRWKQIEEEGLVLLPPQLQELDLQCLEEAGGWLQGALPDLKILEIDGCKSIQSLPQDGLPSSLQELHIYECPAIRSLPKEALPSSLQRLTIGYCPAIIQSLHKDIIPRSLRVLDVRQNYWWGTDRMQLRRRRIKLQEVMQMASDALLIVKSRVTITSRAACATGQHQAAGHDGTVGTARLPLLANSQNNHWAQRQSRRRQ